jgi:hypothetical protein
MAQEPSEALCKSGEIVIEKLEKLGIRIDVARLGVNIVDFLEGKVNIHDDGIHDKVEEWKVWLAALVVLKRNLGYTKSRVLEKFSRIPGYREPTATQQVNAWWDKI